MISQETIEKVKSTVQIVDVVKDYIKLKKQGVNYVGLCPFHNEKSSSFTVNNVKQIYKCFGCGKSGDSIQFIIEHDKRTYVEAIEVLAKKYHIEIEETGPKKEFVRPIKRLEKLNAKKLSWFENDRKISNDTLLRMGVTEAREWMPQFPEEKNGVEVICFNYFRGEELINIKFRGPQKSFKLAKDAELIFYNLNALKGETTGIIVEGEIDTLTLVECGIFNVVGVPNGTPPKNSTMNLEYLNNCWEDFSKLENVIIAVDNDEVGRYLKEELGRRIGKEKCKIVSYPEGCKDPNEILVKLGKAAVVDFISSATDWPIEGIIPMDDMYEEIEGFYKDGLPPGAKSRVEGLDDLITFLPGHLTMVTGIPGHGKDEFTNEIMVSLSKYEDWSWGVFNFEEPAAIHSTKLMEKFTRKAFAFRKNQEHRMNKKEFEYAVGMVDKYFHFVNISKIDVTMRGIISKAIEMVLKYGIRGLIINPYNYLEHKFMFGQSETNYISEILTELVNFLWKYGVHCFLIAHPLKMQKDKKTGKYEVPTLYSITGSSHFFNKTHNGICVYRNYDTNITEIYVQKIKWYWIGQIGWSSYSFNTETRQYSFQSTSVKTALSELGPGKWKSVSELPVPQTLNFSDDEEESEDLPF